ncbi:MAG: hypothetical protein COV07_00590 [Candidatus Vogelbacteria bacterium CG10_big_fil_rev_8_21_14_0_10_45_14]|uniref:Baseplate protein J-like domain-containing protein n=1 Tax=Candidatus Vogelbacteria bacterium CG10_big_fil_rev_8_21_14_0_10_45_14 TaxID=1975042 RepID=A0A2H0RL56_9BACT|nr:MAG: hypothetical protein COV07_00590 [Candidatus Vogelbacteria bacterium CG10_big_fil_rev_8_21_14_0_10_45_14]
MDKNFIEQLKPRSKSKSSSASVVAPERRRVHGGGGRYVMLWVALAVVAVIVVGILVATVRGTATVKVTPIQQLVVVDHIFVGSEKSGDTSGVLFTKESAETTAEIRVPATGVRNVSEFAKGTIAISNEDLNSQRFVARTRFESPDGEIYRTESAILIPGAKMEGGKIVPGRAEANIVADSPGEKSNVSAGTKFTVPGLAGGSLFDKVNAVAQTSISGGFAGELKTASESDILAAKEKRMEEMKATLLSSLQAKVAEKGIIYDDAVFYIFESKRETANIDNDYKETLTGKAVAFVFDSDLLSLAIADRTATDLGSASVKASNLGDLNMRILGRSSIEPSTDSRFSFSVQGNLRLIWQYDENNLKNSLAGIKGNLYQDIFREFPTIERAEAVFTPKWRRTFPKDVSKITIETVLTQ